MSLKSLSDESLHTKTVDLTAEERSLSIEILHHLREIWERRLFAKMGYSSLWEYCIKELRYSEAAAQRRIGAMKLIHEIPETEQKIRDGKLTLTTVSQIQKACKHKRELKVELVKALEGKSKRQVENILAAVSPQQALPERRRVLNDEQVEVRFTVSVQLDKKLERIKALLSHKRYNPTYAELIEMMADLVLEKLDPEKRQKAPPPAEVKRVHSKALRQTRYIRIETKRALYRRAGSRCEFIDSASKRRCEETKCLQVDHILEFARGGTNDLSNLRLYCGAHNRLHAMQSYGVKKMAPFLSV